MRQKYLYWGAPREVVKKTGGWRSVAVDGYIRTEGLSMKFVVDLFDREIEMAEERYYPWTFQTIYWR